MVSCVIQQIRTKCKLVLKFRCRNSSVLIYCEREHKKCVCLGNQKQIRNSEKAKLYVKKKTCANDAESTDLKEKKPSYLPNMHENFCSLSLSVSMFAC